MQTEANVKTLDTPVANSIAPLRNVGLANEAIKRLMDRPAHLPGMGAFYGWSGLGKTIACSYLANKYRAFYVECKSTWTKKAFLQAILTEMGITPAYLIHEMVDQIAEQLVLCGRPLIIDEMDHIVERRAVEIIRDIYESSNAPILMVGEEQFPAKLRRWERFHNRILVWQQAQPADLSDCKHLARLYVPNITIRDDLMGEVLRQSRHAARRIVVNLENIRYFSEKQGLTEVDLKAWGGQELYTGDAPARRNAV